MVIIIISLKIIVWDAFVHQGVVSRKWVSGGHFNQRASLFDNQEDPEDGELLRNIAETYSMNKHRDCREDQSGDLNCRFICGQEEIKEMLVQLLPPVTKEELDKEADEIMAKIQGRRVSRSWRNLSVLC